MTSHDSYNQKIWLNLTLVTLLILPCSVRSEQEKQTVPAGAPSEFELVLVTPPVNPVTLSLDRTGLTDVIAEADRRAAVLLNLTLTTIGAATLESIKNACGGGWQDRDFVPNCPGSWTAEDMHMWRVLTLTPDNASLECTSLSGLLVIAEALADFGLLQNGISDLLADIFNIGRFDAMLSSADVILAIEKNVMATHPAVNNDATLPITLQDTLTDLSELPTRFGPQAGHAGVLDGSDTTTAVLSDSFMVTFEGTDNRLYHEGLDLCYRKNTIALLPEDSEATAEFDFDSLDAVGLVPNPTVDLTLKLTESPNFIAAHTTNNSVNTPALPPNGPGAVWQLSPWLLEYTFADTAFSRYGTRSAYLLYRDPIFSGRLAAITIGMNDDDPNTDPLFDNIINQPGWMRAYLLFGLGNPPGAQYIWESVTELVQQRLHEPAADNCSLLNVSEGDGNARIPLSGVPVGLTRQQFIDGVRPGLEASENALISRLPGPSDIGAVDIFLAGTAGNLYLYFVHPDDLTPANYNYSSPGFFADPELLNKISTTQSLGSGDTIHEKIALTSQPQVIYVQDEFGDVFQVDIPTAESDRVTLQVSGECGVIYEDSFEGSLH